MVNTVHECYSYHVLHHINYVICGVENSGTDMHKAELLHSRIV